ncbi:MAG TPA: flagellar biosynthesis anti-sigma factor FlgM, partial [Burkholderiales bacterium]|nr:flagellar biosynthesis anti-sigma factor FlgM [Burkholderiales bacterium]
TGGAVGNVPAPKTDTGQKIQQTESVQISALSSQLKAMEANMASSPNINLDKVNQIKQAISEGRFKINPEAISSKLISSVKELIQANKRNA